MLTSKKQKWAAMPAKKAATLADVTKQQHQQFTKYTTMCTNHNHQYSPTQCQAQRPKVPFALGTTPRKSGPKLGPT